MKRLKSTAFTFLGFSLFSILLMVFATSSHAELVYNYAAFDQPPEAAHTFNIIGMNDKGQIIGWYTDSNSITHGFIYSKGIYTILDFPGAVSTGVSDINNNGQVVGSYSDNNQRSHGFLYSNGTYITIHPNTIDPNSPFYIIAASSINDSGKIIGTYSLGGTNPTYGFLYSNGVYSTIYVPDSVSTVPSKINNNGQIAGSYGDGLYGWTGHGFLYSNGTYTSIEVQGICPGCGAVSLSASGKIIFTNGSNTASFLYSDSVISPITGGLATGINTSGMIVGWNGGSVRYGFVLAKSGNYTSIIPPNSSVLPQIAYVNAINASGQIAGLYYDNIGVYRGFIASLSADLDNSGTVSCTDWLIIRNSYAKKLGQSGFDAKADINGDGVVDIRDLSYLSQRLPAGTKCQ